METTDNVNSQGPGPAPKSSNSSKSAQKHEAVSKPLAKDPIQGKGLFGKLDKAKKRQDDGHGQGTRRSGLNSCQAQVNELLEFQVQVVEEDKAMLLETVSPVQAEHHKLKDSEWEVIEQCLSLANIVRRILEEFSNKELIKLSLVNKLWNFEARSVLRDRGGLKARILARRPACQQQLVQFAADLQQMRVVPFIGASIIIYHRNVIDACQSLSSESLISSCQVILDRLPWKHLSLRFVGTWLDFKDCPGFLLVRRILEDRCGVLKELYLYYSDFNDFQPIFQYLSFPCLQIIKLCGPPFLESASVYKPAFVKTLVSCAPNLEKLYMDPRTNYKENVMEGSSAVLVATFGVDLFKAQFCESLIDALRTESIWFDDPPRNMELLHRFVPMVIQASHTTLKGLSFHLLFAVPLMCYGILLENVTQLCIRFPYRSLEGIQPHILAVVKGFDFTRVFPKLEKINISQLIDVQEFFLSMYYISAFVERGIAVAREASPDRAINIRHLEFEQYRKDSRPPFIFLSQMFPHVETLSVKAAALETFPFTNLWEHFGSLAELRISLNGSNEPESANLDSVFCGIFPEEVAELRAKDDEYLKAVNIVPIMPSIACMKGLRLFTVFFHYKWDYKLYGSYVTIPPTTWMFSKVTGLIGFSRRPDLSVKLFISRYESAPEVLDHMKPYVTVVTYK